MGPILKKIIVYLEEKRKFDRRFSRAWLIHLSSGLVAFGVVVFFIKVLLPQIKDMLDKMGGEMNFLAKLLINSSDFVKNFGPFVLIGLIILAVAHNWRKTEKGGMSVDRAILKIPLFGNILYLSQMFQLTSLLSTLIWSGIGLTENLRLCEKTITNRFLRDRFPFGSGLGERRESSSRSFEKIQVSPFDPARYFGSGGKNGQLGQQHG